MSSTSAPDGGAPTAPPDVVLEGHIPPEGQRRYIHVPFEVPPGVAQLDVRYDYSDRIASDPDLAGGSTLDIGLFDQRGTESGGPGFRGWSGSARLGFTVGERWATPPYRPGTVSHGEWSVLLGPYKVPPRGTDYRVEVRFTATQPESPSPEATPPPAPAFGPRTIAPLAEPGWVRCDLHSHTVFSDGDSWPAETIAAAWAVGMDVVGVTDHNSAISAAEYAPAGDDGPLLVPGVEVTTYGGHWNAWAAPVAPGEAPRHRWYDFRAPDTVATEAAMAAAVADGALVSINHPKPLGPPWEYLNVASFHAIEVWNGDWEKINTISLSMWDVLLTLGARVVAVGGSDTHRLKAPRRSRLGIPEARFGTPTMVVRSGPGRPTVETVLGAIRRGDCFVTESPDGPELYVHLAGGDASVTYRVVRAAGDALTVIGPDGIVHAAAIPTPDWSTTVAVPRDTPWLRAQVTDRFGRVRVLANPTWFGPPAPMD